jgi:adenylate cyclase
VKRLLTCLRDYLSMIELERTYLAKRLPNLVSCVKTEILDIYLPKTFDKPKIRIRKNGDRYEISKKSQVQEGDFSKFVDELIAITEGEFFALETEIKGKRVHKMRYYYNWGGMTAEFDVFIGELKGLVLIDFKFNREEEMYSFKMPPFCLADVTEDKVLYGGVLCGKAYKDIEKHLAKYSYKRLALK